VWFSWGMGQCLDTYFVQGVLNYVGMMDPRYFVSATIMIPIYRGQPKTAKWPKIHSRDDYDALMNLSAIVEYSVLMATMSAILINYRTIKSISTTM